MFKQTKIPKVIEPHVAQHIKEEIKKAVAEDQTAINDYVREKLNEKFEKDVVSKYLKKDICLNCRYGGSAVNIRVSIKEMKNPHIYTHITCWFEPTLVQRIPDSFCSHFERKKKLTG